MVRKNKYIIYCILGVAVLSAILIFVLVGGKKKEYLVVFDSSGGTGVESQVVVEKSKVTKPTDPERENYNFIRWEYQNREYDFNSEVISDMTLKAVWEEVKEEIKYYDVEFTVDGITKKISVSVITEKDLEELGFEEKDGYEIKWYVNDEEYDFSTPLSANISIVGKYVKVDYFTVKFNSNGGNSIASQKIKGNEKVIEPTDVKRHGFILDGWYLDNKKFDFSTPITKNITLTAKWKEDESVKRYEVTFNSDGGSKVDKQRVIENETAKEPKAPTKSGFKFVGWYLSDKAYNFKNKVTSNITLKAKWEKIIQYTVTFDKDNGTANDVIKINAGSKITKPKNPTKDGFRFDNWLLDDKAFDFNTIITGDITLKASYTPLPKYTVTFDGNGGSTPQSQIVVEGKTASEPSKPTRSGYDFVEWRLNGNKYVFSTPVNKDITLVAIWKQQTHTYKVVATKVDNFSLDSKLKIYRDNVEIPFNSNIKINGVVLTSSIVTTSELSGATIMVIDNGSEHRATLVMQ